MGEPVTRRDPVLIIGLGLAGACLHQSLTARGQEVVVATDSGESASRVAAGLVSPVTGPRLSLPPETAACLGAATSLYRHAEDTLGRRLWHPAPIRRLFLDARERERWQERRRHPEWRAYLAEAQPPNHHPGLADPEGSGLIRGGGHVAIEPLLDGLLQRLARTGHLRPPVADLHQLEVDGDGVRWQGERFAATFFCEGAGVRHNPWFDWLPVQPLKGEVLTLARPEGIPEHPLNRRQWLVPDSAETIRVGATHEQRPADLHPSSAGRERLLDAARAMLGRPVTEGVLAHRAGWRPTVPDRRPVAGMHPRQPRLGILNGFGGRGAFWGPFHAGALADHWLLGHPLPPACDVARYWKEEGPCT